MKNKNDRNVSDNEEKLSKIVVKRERKGSKIKIDEMAPAADVVVHSSLKSRFASRLVQIFKVSNKKLFSKFVLEVAAE